MTPASGPKIVQCSSLVSVTETIFYLGKHLLVLYTRVIRLKNTPFRRGLPPRGHRCAHGLLMLQNSLNKFVFEHRSGCCAPQPGYVGDIGPIEI